MTTFAQELRDYLLKPPSPLAMALVVMLWIVVAAAVGSGAIFLIRDTIYKLSPPKDAALVASMHEAMNANTISPAYLEGQSAVDSAVAERLVARLARSALRGVHTGELVALEENTDTLADPERRAQRLLFWAGYAAGLQQQLPSFMIRFEGCTPEACSIYVSWQHF